MDRDEAARLLGVPVDADATTVRHAYRMWARVAHPDAGGDPVHFARLTQARRALLRPLPWPSSAPDEHAPRPRAPLTAMLRRPEHLVALLAGAIAAAAVAAVPLLGVAPPIGALMAGMASASWSAITTRAILRRGADAGHRIAALACTWVPLAAMQVALSTLLGTQFVAALPLLALPFAGVVASVNAGAGLWRPIGEAKPPIR